METVVERIALLGQGGMGEVYRATDLKLGQPVLALLSVLALAAYGFRCAVVGKRLFDLD